MNKSLDGAIQVILQVNCKLYIFLPVNNARTKVLYWQTHIAMNFKTGIYPTPPVSFESNLAVMSLLTLILAVWLQICLPEHKTAVTSLLFIQKNSTKYVILPKRLVFNFL
jgi:hypothetical protein